jgi:hypothetical protein
MAIWREMSLDNRKAAQQLLLVGCHRSSISRSYFAAYCILTEVFSETVTFSHGGNNPSHQDLPQLILHNLHALPMHRRMELLAAFRRLWKARVDADYGPKALIGRFEALSAFREANRIFYVLGV